MAIKQKAISCKLDYEILAKLDKYCNKTGYMRNRIINQAVDEYLAAK